MDTSPREQAQYSDPPRGGGGDPPSGGGQGWPTQIFFPFFYENKIFWFLLGKKYFLMFSHRSLVFFIKKTKKNVKKCKKLIL